LKTNIEKKAILASIVIHLFFGLYLSQQQLQRQYLGEQNNGITLNFDERVFQPTPAEPLNPPPLPTPVVTAQPIAPSTATADNITPTPIENQETTTINDTTKPPTRDTLQLTNTPPTPQNLLDPTADSLTSLIDSISLREIDTIGLLVYQAAFVDEKPYFPDGFDAMLLFFTTYIEKPKDFPALKGTVHIELIVLENGQFANLRIKKTPFTDQPAFQDEALRVAAKMPRWSPGKIKGIPVKTLYTIPVVFQ
jgi:protein TonB